MCSVSLKRIEHCGDCRWRVRFVASFLFVFFHAKAIEASQSSVGNDVLPLMPYHRAVRA